MENNSNGIVAEGAGVQPAETADLLNGAIDAASGVESAPTEPAKPEVNKEAEEQAKFAARFAALARKEKQLKAKEREMEARLKQWEQSSQTKEKEIENFKSIPERLKKDPLGVMKEFGLTYEQLTEMVLNDGKPTQDMHLKEALTPVEKKLQELEAKLAEKEAKEQESKLNETKNGFMKGLKDFVAADPDAYELIASNNAYDLVYDVIETHYNQKMQEYVQEYGEQPDVETANQFILSNKDASDAVENYLLEEAKKVTNAKKIRKLLQPTEPTPVKPTPQSQAAGAKTLSNTLSAAVPSQTTRKFMSDEESKAQAAKLIRWDD